MATVTTPINASATGFASVGGSLNIVDDDAPKVSLSFANTVVSKGAANPATLGTLTVSTATTQAVTVLLGTTSPAITIPGTAVIPANTTNVTFPVSVVQDNLVTGDRVAVVSAQLADAISQVPLPHAATTAQITVTDDNGPALTVTLANSTIAENGSTTATVTRNTLPTNALTVNLASTLTSAATVPANVTIPINSASKTFTVTGVNPGVPTGPRVADITASASGYGSGVAPLTVSDINIPDLVVTSVTAPTTGLTTSNITVTYVIANTGLGATTNVWHDAIYYSTSPSGSNPQLLTEILRKHPAGCRPIQNEQRPRQIARRALAPTTSLPPSISIPPFLRPIIRTTPWSPQPTSQIRRPITPLFRPTLTEGISPTSCSHERLCL